MKEREITCRLRTSEVSHDVNNETKFARTEKYFLSNCKVHLCLPPQMKKHMTYPTANRSQIFWLVELFNGVRCKP